MYKRQVLCRQANSLEQGVANHERHAAAVLHHDVSALERCRTGRRAGVRPLIHEARVDGADHQAQPRHDVVELLGTPLDGHGAVERAVRLGEVSQQDPLATGDFILRDVALEVAAGPVSYTHLWPTG